MRIHTSLTYQQIREVVQTSGAPVYTEVLSQHRSRTHDRAFEVILSGSSTSRSQSGDYFAATWDEWGAFFGALYDMDRNARCGGNAKFPTYQDAEHFHFATSGRFHYHFDQSQPSKDGSYLPADTHPRHHWEYDSDGFHCTKCSASRPTWDQQEAYAPRSYDTAV